MSNKQIIDDISRWNERLRALEMDPDKRLLWVDVANQVLSVCDTDRVIAQYPISTAENGLGCEQDSYKTPFGIHVVAEKIGEGEPSGAIFRGRVATGERAEICLDDRDSGEDLITSRILWLDGMQLGVNHGEGVDSRDRYIYIHGTNEEGRIGQAISHGCIRMRNDDVIALFDLVTVNTVVIIQ